MPPKETGRQRPLQNVYIVRGSEIHFALRLPNQSDVHIDIINLEYLTHKRHQD